MIVAPSDYSTLPKDLVLVGGCFDPLHPGHLAYFDSARVFGPVCCVVASDETIRATKGRPALLPQADRMELVAALEAVDFVIAQDEAGEAGALEDLRPKFYMKGQDWQGTIPAEIEQACAQFEIPQLFHQARRKDSSSNRLRAWQQGMDALAVARLEALMQRQQPASKPWAPVTDYSFEVRRITEGLHPKVIKDTFQPVVALDYGCGPNEILVRLLREIGVRVDGYDPQISGSLAYVDGKGYYDLVICREVLEHLTVSNLKNVVAHLVALSSKFVYVTTRFAADSDHLLDVDESDDLDPTHITMLSKDFLRTLFVLEGCTSRPDLEARMDWQQKGRCLVFEVGQ